MVTYDPSYKTAPITQYGNPTQTASLYPTSPVTVQQGMYVDARKFLFVTQLNSAGDGTVITKFDGPATSTTHNDPIEQMTIIGAGHGIAIHVEDPVGYTYIWLSLPDRLARFKWVPGYSGSISGLTDLTWQHEYLNYAGQTQESVYNFDNATGFCVERQFDFAPNAFRERYTRRKITDVKAGIDQPYGQFFAPVNNPTTLQGFATINDTLFRWVGGSNADTLGKFNAADPMAIEQWDWNTGQRVGYKEFPTLAQTNNVAGQLWKDGKYEPEGACVIREADGTASLLVGVTVGLPGNHRWPIYKFSSIGQA